MNIGARRKGRVSRNSMGNVVVGSVHVMILLQAGQCAVSRVHPYM